MRDYENWVCMSVDRDQGITYKSDNKPSSPVKEEAFLD